QAGSRRARGPWGGVARRPFLSEELGCVAQAGLELLGSSDPPASASRVLGPRGVGATRQVHSFPGGCCFPSPRSTGGDGGSGREAEAVPGQAHSTALRQHKLEARQRGTAGHLPV
ncbi:hypothetical protein H1C71_007925, partial [Ictidomys tridecemlineatus]